MLLFRKVAWKRFLVVGSICPCTNSLKSAKQNKTSLSVIWLDVANAYSLVNFAFFPPFSLFYLLLKKSLGKAKNINGFFT